MTETEVRKLVAMLLAGFPHTKALPETARTYERMLGDLEATATRAALEHLMATRNYLPTIAEVRAAVAEMQQGPVKAGGEAWGEVLRAIGRYGYYRTPGEDFALADPVAMRCIDSLGWRNLCNSENSQADRARFIELYDKLAKQERTNVVAGSLPAVAEMRRLREGGEAQSISVVLGGLLPPKGDS